MAPSTAPDFSAHPDLALPIAWERAFALAGAHGHLWAESLVDNELVGLHVALVAAQAALDASPEWYDTTEEAFEATHRRDAARDAFEAAVRARRESDAAGRAPRSRAEAHAACAAALVDNAFPTGVGPSLHHVTGTGRLSWQVAAATGWVVLSVRRPAGEVIRVSVTDTSEVIVWLAEHGSYGVRHLDALRHALRALGAELPLELALGAEDEWALLAGQAEEAAAADPSSAERLRARSAAIRAWARLRRPVIAGGTPAAYAAMGAEIAAAQRAAAAVVFGGVA